MTHDELVERAVRWLKNSAKVPCTWDVDKKLRPVRCSLVLAEITTATSETPDAIGFANAGLTSIVIECKASESDFYSDRKKPFRQYPDMGMGRWRWYMTPKGLIRETMSVLPGWGVLEVCGKVVRVKRLPEEMPPNRESEAVVLHSVVNRLRVGGDDYRKPIR